MQFTHDMQVKVRGHGEAISSSYVAAELNVYFVLNRMQLTFN